MPVLTISRNLPRSDARLTEPSTGFAACDASSTAGRWLRSQSCPLADKTETLEIRRARPNQLQIDSEGVFTAGISYKLGKAQFMGAFSNVKFKGFGKTSNMPTFDVGGLYDIRAFLIAIFGYQHTNFEGTHWNQISFGGDYLLSKRTDVYLATSYVKASDGVHANSTASFTPSSTNGQASVRIALRHRF